MARIKNYVNDTQITTGDKFIGTDQASGQTKNFTFGDLVDTMNSDGLLDSFDGALYKFTTLGEPGAINITGTSANVTSLSAITQLIVNTTNLQGDNITNYLDNLVSYHIKISSSITLDTFATYRVDSISNYDANHKKLILTYQQGNGTLNPGAKYFLSLFQASYDTDLSDRSVTEFGDVTDAGSGAIITGAERALVHEVPNKIYYSDIVDNLTSNNTDKPLSAKQGLVLKGFIDNINTLLASDNVDLDTLQEIVDFIENNKDILDGLTISNIAGLQNALDLKVDKVTGKELSANDFTDVLLAKLNGIAAGAEVNVQSDWNQANNTQDDYIKNKPSDVTNLALHSVEETNDVFDAGSGYIITDLERTKLNNINPGSNQIITDAERTKLNGIAAGAEVNVQADWNVTDVNADAHIKNKPDVVTTSRQLDINGTANEIEVVPDGLQNLSTDRVWTIGLPNDVTISNDLTVNNKVDVTDTVSTGKALVFTQSQSEEPTGDNVIYVKQKGVHEVMHFKYHGHDLSLDTLTEIIPTGITSGGQLAAFGTTQFTVQGGTAIINKLNKADGVSEPYPEIQYIEWETQTIDIFNLDDLDPTQKNAWIYIDENGVIQQQSTPFTDGQHNSVIILGAAIHALGQVLLVRSFPTTAYGNVSQLQEFTRIFGPMKKDGHLLYAAENNLKLSRTQGTSYAPGRNYINNPESPSIVIDAAKVNATIYRYYSNGLDGWIQDTNSGAGYTTVDPSKWENNGLLANVPGGSWTIQRVYFFPSTPNLLVTYYGARLFSSEEDAERHLLTSSADEAPNTASQAIYLGAIILKGGCLNLNDVSQAVIYKGGIFRSLSSSPVGTISSNAVLNDLTDVAVQTPSDNDFLTYNATTSQWINISRDLVFGGEDADRKEALFAVVGLSDIYYTTKL